VLIGRTRGETWQETLAYLVYRAVSWLAYTLPETRGRRLFSRVGRLAYRVLPRVRATVAANQGRVVGRDPADPIVQAATVEAFESYARFWFDAFHAAHWSDEEVLRRFRADGGEEIDRALEAGAGAIIALPHMGNWDVAGRWLDARDQGPVVVAERLKPDRLFELFVAHRERLGMEVVGLNGEGVGRQLTAALKRNRVVCLVADRDLGGGGVPVEMFGATRRLPAGPALLSITTGAPLLTASIREEAGGYRLVILAPPPVELTGERRRDVVTLTRALAHVFERSIAASPTDWHMFQPGWEP
jgi:phosphatidylinositol dimannoside acyltransferase